MLGMHGTVAANYAVDGADLLLAVGVRFDDRVTGKLEAFAARARIVHIDIDPAEINKNKHSHVTVCADARPSLQVPNPYSLTPAALLCSCVEGRKHVVQQLVQVGCVQTCPSALGQKHMP